MSEDLYCKVYLNEVSDLQALKALVVDASRGALEGRTVRALGLLIDIFENRQAAGGTSAPDDFVGWPFYLEIEPSDDGALQFDGFLASLASLLIGLRERGLGVVPSCDFEERLEAAMI